MTVRNWIVLTPAQILVADQGGPGWGNGEVALGARLMDNESPGVGLNINPDAADYEPGDVVALVGNGVVEKRMLDDPDYQMFAPDMLSYLEPLPRCMLEEETIFAPPPVWG